MPVMSKEQASQTSNLQGGVHDPSDENKHQKIYLISWSNYLKKDKACRDCNPSERKKKNIYLTTIVWKYQAGGARDPSKDEHQGTLLIGFQNDSLLRSHLKIIKLVEVMIQVKVSVHSQACCLVQMTFHIWLYTCPPSKCKSHALIFLTSSYLVWHWSSKFGSHASMWC